MKILKKVSILAILGIIFVTGCSKTSKDKGVEPISATEFVFNTVSMISIYENKGDKDSNEIINEAFDLCVEYEHLFSRTYEGSDIWNINNSEGKPVLVSDETIYLLDHSSYYGHLSSGVFDVTLGKISEMWDFTGENPQVPDPLELEEALSHTGFEKIKINGNEVTLEDPNAKIDLGGIAKGYAADKVKDFLMEKGITSGVINLGGNIVVFGGKPSSKGEEILPFAVAITEPTNSEKAETIGYFSIEDGSVVTSGNYERYFEEGGIRYHHILDPKTGYPSESGLDSVTIYSEKSADGDALSTLCFVLGAEKSLPLIESMENTEAVFITSEGGIIYTSGIDKTVPYTKLK